MRTLLLTTTPVMSMLICIAVSACGGTSRATLPPRNDAQATADMGVQSVAILAREPVANRVSVRHILIAWSELAASYQGSLDPRAVERSKAQAEELIVELHTRTKAGESFAELMAGYSEDQGSAATGRSFDVSPDAGLVLDFKRLSLRLEIGESGIVETPFGFHLILRDK